MFMRFCAVRAIPVNKFLALCSPSISVCSRTEQEYTYACIYRFLHSLDTRIHIALMRSLPYSSACSFILVSLPVFIRAFMILRSRAHFFSSVSAFAIAFHCIDVGCCQAPTSTGSIAREHAVAVAGGNDIVFVIERNKFMFSHLFTQAYASDRR
jgi:hypothetical protein